MRSFTTCKYMFFNNKNKKKNGFFTRISVKKLKV